MAAALKHAASRRPDGRRPAGQPGTRPARASTARDLLPAAILPRHMGASSKRAMSETEETAGTATDALASDRDEAGVPVHRGWAPLGGRHRWMEPFVLVVLATTGAHGYAITGRARGDGDHRRRGRRRPGLPDAPRPRGIRPRDVDVVDGGGRPAAARVRADRRRLRGPRRVGGRHEGAGPPHRRSSTAATSTRSPGTRSPRLSRPSRERSRRSARSLAGRAAGGCGGAIRIPGGDSYSGSAMAWSMPRASSSFSASERLRSRTRR